MEKNCHTYEEARAIHARGRLQINVGTRTAPEWRDAKNDECLFFGRDPEDYREKPEPPEQRILVEYRQGCGSRALRVFNNAADVANFIWGRDVTEFMIFTEWKIPSHSITAIEKALHATLQ